ncbi:MAG: hypothetical protein ACAI37_13495 [Chthoniobacter sp.]
MAVKRPFLIIAGLCGLLALGAWWQYFEQSTKVTAEATEKLSPKVTELQNYEKKINQAKADIKAQQETARPYLTAVEEKTYWIDIIEDINSRIPRDFVWVTDFDIAKVRDLVGAGGAGAKKGGGGGGGGSNEPTLLLKGLYLFNNRQQLVVDDFINKLKESNLYTVDKDHIVRTLPNEQEWAYEFQIPLVLKNSIVTVTNEK